MTDRDAQAQRALLGDIIHILGDTPSSPLNTPSPSINGLSPLSVASHLQDASDADINPFLDASWKMEADHYQPVRLVPSSRISRSVSVPVTPDPSPATLLPTIQEAASSPISRRLKQNTSMATYSLPPSALGITTTSRSASSSTTQIRRRPSPFPLGPPPPPPPQRRARYEPRPHIVDIATEQFNLKPTSSNTSTSLQQERERQWKLWDEERLRSLEMTREAAKNNRVQTSRAHPSTPVTVVVQEKPSPSSASPKAPSPSTASKSNTKRRWWCFGNGATESDVEDNEKHNNNNTLSRSSSRVSTVSSVASEEDDEEEWDEARTAPGLLGFGCAMKRSRAPTTTRESRPRATLKKRSAV